MKGIWIMLITGMALGGGMCVAETEIPHAQTWNAESVFADNAAWAEAADAFSELLPGLQAYEGRLAEGPATLADFREKQDAAKRLGAKVSFYASMKSACDATDKEAIAMSGRARGLMGRYSGTVAFARPEMLAIGKETLLQWTGEDKRLAHLGQYIDNLFRQQAHVRSADVEEVMGMVDDPFGGVQEIFGMLTSADMRFKPALAADGSEHPLTQSRIRTYYYSPDRQLRQSAHENYTDAYLAHKNTLAATYLASVKQDVFNARVRGFDSSLSASLFANNIPEAVFRNLVDTYKKNIPTWQRYWQVRRRVLGLEQLSPYDIWAPLSAAPPTVPFEESVGWICEGMKPLGDAYVRAMRKGCLEDRWVDRYPNPGKREGAFSYGTHDTFPFIMMSYDDTLSAMSTLAHELGHSMHSYYSRNARPSDYSRYSLFVAEVASNFNQAMTRAYLREAKAEDIQFQIALIDEAMNNFHRYFFIMPTLARFELEVHERVERGEGLTADDLIELCANLFAEGYGEEMTYDRDRVGITWATFGHLYNNFYVYQYATGISGAHELAKGILAGEPGAADRYLEFLSAGSSVYPLDILQRAGVDLTQPAAVETTFRVLAEMVDRLESLAESAGSR